MLDLNEIRRIAKDVAVASLPPLVKDVRVEPAIGWRGDDLLNITIIVEEDAAERISGEDTLNTSVQMQRRISDAGDERLPIVYYATEEELQDLGNS